MTLSTERIRATRVFAALIAALALALAASAATAPRAHAALPAGPASSLKDAFSGSPTSLLQALACPAANAAATTTSNVPGVGEVTNQLKNVICALNVLGYAYRTTYVPASGQPVVRYTRAIALIGTLLDVDGNGSPDFTANAAPTVTLNGISLTIGRLGFPLTNFPASGKVSVEAVFLDPLAPDTYLGVGEDGTAAGTAAQWKATVSVFGLSSTGTDLGLAINASGGPSKLAVLGEVFSGTNPDQPTTVNRGNVGFTPVPGNVTTEIRLSERRQQALVSALTPTKVDAHVNLIKNGKQRDIDATIDKLSSVDVVHTTQDDHENVTFTADAPIAALSGAYHERTSSGIATAVQIDATSVPKKITFDQIGSKTTIDAPGSSFGSVEARFAKGTDVPDPGAGTAPYAAFHRFSATKLTGGLRLKNLKSVAIDQGTPLAGELIFSAPLGTLPLTGQDDVTHVTLTGSLKGLPLDTSVVADLDNGAVTFDGHGTGIEQIALSATKTGGTFFSKASRIDATIDGIPALETINFKQEDGSVKVAASDPPATISLLASNGAPAPEVDGSYAWFEDTATTYRAFARISRLKGIAFSSDPVAGTFDTGAAQVLNLHGEVGTIKVAGKIDKLPSHVDFSVVGDRVHIANNGTIDHINLEARGLPASAKFRNAKVDIFGISPVLDVYLGINPANRSANGTATPVADGTATQPTARKFRAPCNPNTDPDCEPPCNPQTDPDGCEPPPPPPPPPPPVIPDPELFGVDAHGAGVELITAHAWVDDADLELHPDLATNRSAARKFRAPCNPNTDPNCDEPPCNPNTDPDCEPPPPPPTPVTPPPFGVPTTANAVLYDGKTGHEDLRARISNLKHAFYTKNAEPKGPDGYPVFNGTDDVDIEFTQPGDITLGIRKQDSVHGTLTIPQVTGRTLPTKYGLKIGTQRVIQANFRPNAVIPKVEVSMAAGKDADGERKALIAATIENIPTVADVCIAKDGFPDCKSFMSDTVATGGASNIVISPEIDFNLKTNGPPVTDPGAMTINGRICLGDIGSNAWVPAACLSNQTAKKYVDITNLKVSNFDVEYRGEGINSKYCGNCGDDDALAAYLNTDGVMVDKLQYVKDGGTGVEFVKTGQPLTADDFFFAINYSFTARFGTYFGPVGTLSCPGNTDLFLLDRDSATGAVSHKDIPGPNNLMDYNFLVGIC